MMSFQILALVTFAVVSEAALYRVGSDAFATRNIQPNSDETKTEVVPADVAEDIKERQERRRAIREMKERKLEAVREEADERAKQAMEAARNATLASDRARHKLHEQMKQTAEPQVVPSSTVVHLVRVPHKKNHTNHTHKNHTNQTQVPMNKSEPVVQQPPLSKALASKNISHTMAHANASRLNVTKAVARHKDQMTAKASGISNATKAAASKGVSAAFHSARMAAEKLRKNHLAKRASITKERKSTSEESFEDKQKDKIKKNVIAVEGDELAEALKSVLSFPAKVPDATTTSTTATTTVTTTTSTVATTTTIAPSVTSTNVSTDATAQNTTKEMNSTQDVAHLAIASELTKIEAEIKEDKVEKQKAIEKDDLETALTLKKELGSLEKKEAALEAAVNKTADSKAGEALKSPLKAARTAASKLRGSQD